MKQRVTWFGLSRLSNGLADRGGLAPNTALVLCSIYRGPHRW